jgi:hypothetical protein
VIYGQVGLVVALAAFLQVGVGSTRRSAGWALGFGLVVVGFLLSDHVFSGYVAGPVLGFALLATTIAAPTWTERWWKLGALLGAGMVVVALGIPQWMLALTASISRTVFFDELIAQPQHAYTAGVLFRPTDAFTLVGVLAILGIVGDLAWGDRRQRALAAISGLLTLGLVAAGVIWLTTDFKWRGPAPAFFSVMTFPWLALSAVRGLDYAMSWRPTCVTGRYWLPLALAAVLGVCFAGSILWVLANRESLVSRFLRSGVMRDLGFLSFGIYMWHVIVKVLVFYRFQTVELSRFPTDARFVLMFSYYVLGSLAIATVTYFFVERPFLRLKDHFITSASIRHSKPKRTSRINWRFWGWYCLLPAVGVVIVETILRLR